MANIDVTKIEGYENMTPEEKIKALESFEYDDGSTTISKLKESVSKACSDAAEWKRKHNDLLSEEERAKAEREERDAAVKARLDELELKEKITENMTHYLDCGYSAELAKSSAEALAKGDNATLFANERLFRSEIQKTSEAELLKNTPKPPAGNPTQGITKDKFLEMSTEEQDKYISENPDWQKTLK